MLGKVFFAQGTEGKKKKKKLPSQNLQGVELGVARRSVPPNPSSSSAQAASHSVDTHPRAFRVQEASDTPAGSSVSPSVKWSCRVAWETEEAALGKCIDRSLVIHSTNRQ